MKIYLCLPDGGEFYCESEPREPISQARFETICWLVGILGGASLLVYFFLSLCR